MCQPRDAATTSERRVHNEDVQGISACYETPSTGRSLTGQGLRECGELPQLRNALFFLVRLTHIEGYMLDLVFSSLTKSFEFFRSTPTRLGFALVVSGMVISAPSPTHRARAQQRPERISDQLALARICASEVGFYGDHEECAAIHQVLRRRAERLGFRFITAARAYSGRVFDTDRRDPRAYVAHLRPDGRRPALWPTISVTRRRGQTIVRPHAPWTAFRDRWLALYEAAGRIVRGELASECQTPPDHWGMRGGIDLERARRAGWVEIDCGETANAFWSIQAPVEH